jgi:hypothetical protein
MICLPGQEQVMFWNFNLLMIMAITVTNDQCLSFALTKIFIFCTFLLPVPAI